MKMSRIADGQPAAGCIQTVMHFSSAILVDPLQERLLVAGCRAFVPGAHAGGSWVSAVSIASDGKTFLTGGADGSIKLWNVATGLESNFSFLQKAQNDDHNVAADAVTAARFTKDGKGIVAGGHSGALRIYKLAASDSDVNLPCGASPKTQAFVPPAFIDPSAHVGPISSIDVTSASVTATSLSQSGNRRVAGDIHTIVTGGRDGTVKVWKASIGPLKSPCPEDASDAADVDLENGGDCSCFLLQTIADHTAVVSGVCFLGGLSSCLVSCSADRRVLLWQLQTKKEQKKKRTSTLWASVDEEEQHPNHFDLGLELFVRSSCVSVASCVASSRWSVANDTVTVVVGSWDGRLEVWRVLVHCLDYGEANSFAVSPPRSSRRTDSASSESTSASPPIGERPSVLAFLAHDEPIYSVSVAGNGATMASGSIDRSVKVWDVSTGVLKSVLRGQHRNAVLSVDMSCSGHTLVSGSRDGEMQLWHLSSGCPISRLDGHEAPINEIVLSCDGRTAATASSDGTARLWDLRSGESLAVLRGHNCSVDGVRFSFDGQTLATSGVDGSAKLWSVETGDLIATIDS
jgi:WD40 repeat protein